MTKPPKVTTYGATDFVLTPDNLLSQLRIESPREVVTVKGIVERLTPYSKGKDNAEWVYGVLRGVDAAMSFRCPASNTPTQEGKAVVLTGNLVVRPNRHQEGLDVTLYGEPTGTWTPAFNQTANIVRLEKKHTRLSLNTFLRNHGLDSLRILATTRGTSDLLAAASKHDIDLNRVVRKCRFDKKEPLLDTLRETANDTAVKGIAFVRGGSGEDASLRMWNDAAFLAEIIDTGLPFYTAIGHSDILLLADKYCDESFTTPTAIGDSLAQAMLQLEKESRQEATLKRLYKERDRMESERHALLAKQRRLQRIIMGTCAVVIVGGGLWYWTAHEKSAAMPAPVEKIQRR